MHIVSAQLALDDPLRGWRVGGSTLSSVSDTGLADEPPLVGRDDLLARFERLAIRAHTERLVLALSGEAGIGKTRLLREFGRRARDQQRDVGWVAGPAAPWLRRGATAPRIVLCDGVAAGAALLAASETGTAEPGPGVLTALVVPTSDPDERGARRLDRALAAAARHGRLVEVRVPPLTEPELVELTRLVVGGPPGVALRQAVWRLSEGNPYLAIQVSRTLIRDGLIGPAGDMRELRHKLSPDFLPVVVASDVLHTIRALGPAAVTTLATAAAIGPGFQFDLLTRVCREPPEQVLADVEVGVAHGVLREAPAPPDDFQFVHELVRRALYRQLNAVRRQHVHQAVATRLEAEQPPVSSASSMATLAYHFSRGLDRHQGLAYARRALAHSEALCAWDDAIRDCRRALNLARQVEVADVVELELLEHLAGLYFSRAQSSAAGTCWDAALRLCERSGDLPRRAVQLARLAALGPPWASIDEAEQADAAAQAAVPSASTGWRFDACIELAMANERFGRLSDAIDYGRAAAELVRADDALAYALALVNLGNPLTGAGHPAEAVAVLTSALDVLDRHPYAHLGEGTLVDPLRDPRRLRCLALADLARALVFVGELDRALTTARRACLEEERLDMRGGRARRALAQIRLAQRQPRDALDALARSDASASAELLGASFAAELLLLAEAQCAAGDPASGQQTALDGIRICGRSGAHEYLAGLYLAEGRARLAQGDVAAVEQAVASARLTIEVSGTLIFEPQLLQLEADTRAARHLSGADVLRRRAAALTRSMGSADRSVGPPEVGQHALTQRELEVLALVAEGRTNRHIAEALVVSDKTVKRHLSNILAKLGVAEPGGSGQSGAAAGTALKRVECSDRRHRGVVVGLRHLVGDVLDVGQSVGAVDHEDRPLEQAPFLDQHAVAAAEVFVLVCRERPMPYPGRAAPAGLGERQVHADRVQLGVGRQLGQHLVPAPGLDVADRCVERVDDVEQAHSPGGVGQPHRAQLAAGRVERFERQRGAGSPGWSGRPTTVSCSPSS